MTSDDFFSADVNSIKIGANVTIGDKCMVHCSKDHPTVIGDRVVVGSGAIIHGFTSSFLPIRSRPCPTCLIALKSGFFSAKNRSNMVPESRRIQEAVKPAISPRAFSKVR